VKGGLMNRIPAIYGKMPGRDFGRGLFRDSRGVLFIIWSYMMAHEVGDAILRVLFDLKHKKQNFFFRATNNKKEHEICGDIQSFNFRDKLREKGLSVSEHPFYHLWGSYKYIYVVTGDFVGYGSDGEPLIKNCRPLTIPSRSVPKKYLNAYNRLSHGVEISEQEEKLLRDKSIAFDADEILGFIPAPPIRLIMEF
jgi:hypothetical protein